MTAEDKLILNAQKSAKTHKSLELIRFFVNEALLYIDESRGDQLNIEGCRKRLSQTLSEIDRTLQ